MRTNKRTSLLLAAIASVAAGSPLTVRAATYWTGGSGNWSNDSNWSTSTAPVAETVWLTQGDAIDRTVTYDAAADTGSGLESLAINATGSGNMTLVIPAGAGNTLSIAPAGNSHQMFVGHTGHGALIQNGGALVMGSSTRPANLAIGYNRTAIGTYTMNGADSSIQQYNGIYVGWLGTGTRDSSGQLTQAGGTFVQNAGTVTTGNIYAGTQWGSTGSYVLNGGNIVARVGTLGYEGSGTFTQNGGSYTFLNSGLLILGYNSAGLGTYDMNGTTGTLSGASGEIIGYASTGRRDTSGTLIQAGGTFNQKAGLNSTGTLDIGQSFNTTGAYNLSGGTLSVGSVFIVGDAGQGIFTQSGGNSTGGNLTLGNRSGSVGAYSMTDAAAHLTVNIREVVGYSATGTVSNGVLAPGATFDQTAGTHAVNGLFTVAWQPKSTGAYFLRGGSLTVTSTEVVGDAGTATFTQTGGTHTVGQPSLNTNLYIGLSGNTGPSTYSLDGAAAVLTVNGNTFLGGSTGVASGRGVLNISAGIMTVTGSMKIWSSGDTGVNLSGGSLSVGSLTNSGTVNYLSGSGGNRQITGGGVTNSGIISGLDGTPVTLTLNALTLNAGGTLKFDLGAPGTSDKINVLNSNGLIFAGATGLDLNNIGGLSGGTYTLVDYAGTFGGSLANLSVGTAPGGFTYSLLNNAGNTSIDLLVTPSGQNVWTGGSGTWDTNAKWNGGAAPNSSTAHVRIDAAPGTTSAVTLATSVSVGDITLDAGDTLGIDANRTLAIAGPGDSALNGAVNNSGTIAVNAGTTHLAGGGTHSGKFAVASGAGVDFAGGTHTLTTTTSLTGAGLATISGGTVNAPAGLLIDDTSPAVTITGGTLAVTDTVLLAAGAKITQTGGTHTINGIIHMTGNATTYDMSGGTMTVNSNDFTGGVRVGYDGNVTFALSGNAQLNSNTNVNVGIVSTSHGTFDQTGGTHTIDAAHTLFIGREAGAHGAYELGGGTLQANGNMNVGLSGNGTFHQTSGEATVTGLVFLANGSSSTGDLTVDGGTFTARQGIFVGGDTSNPGGTATFTINGGTVNSTTGVLIWQGGTMNLNPGGTLNAGDTFADNIRNEGTINNNGGALHLAGQIYGDGVITNASGNVVFADRTSVRTRDIAVSGGEAVANGTLLVGDVAGSPGILNVSGGDVLVNGVLAVGNDGTLSAGSGEGHVNVSGGTFYADTILLGSSAGGSGDMIISGTGDVRVGGGITCNRLVINGGTLSVLDLPAPPDEDPVLERAIVAGYVHEGAMEVNAGTVAAPILKIGVNQQGTYTQTGGTMTVDGLLALGGANSLFDIRGGTLNTGHSEVDGNAALTIGDGTNVAAELHLTGNGTHSFADGLLLSSDARLSGTGTISGNVASSGTIAPGNSPGTLDIVGDLTLNTGAEFSFDLGTISDLIAISGRFIDGGTGPYNFDFAAGSGFAPGTYTLITFGDASGITADDFTFTSSNSGITGEFAMTANALTFTAVPEPSSMVVAATGAICALAARRARRRQAA